MTETREGAATAPQGDEMVRVYEMRIEGVQPLIVEGLDVLWAYLGPELLEREKEEVVEIRIGSMTRAALDALPEWQS